MGHADWISNAPILGRLAITPLDFLVGFDLTAAAVPVAAIVVAAALVGLMRLAASRLSRRSRPASGGDAARRHLHPAAGTRAASGSTISTRAT